MSIEKPGPLPPQQPTTSTPGPVGGGQVTPPGPAGPRLQTHQPESGADWQELPNDVVGHLMHILTAETVSTDLTPDERSASLGALLSLGGTSKREQQVLDHLLKQTGLDRQELRETVMKGWRSQWLAESDHMEDQRDQLLVDFSVTRTLIIDAERTKAAIVLPDDREGVEFCFKEIGFSSAISTLMSTLNGKTVKLDASGIGRDRFVNEILPALEKIPGDCRVVLDAAGNNLTSDYLERLVILMAKKRNLYRLDLSGNPLSTGASGAAQIVNLFTHRGPLSYLYLSNTGFDTATANLLKDSPSMVTVLQQVDLRDNQLDEAGVIAVMKGLIPEDDRSGLVCPHLHLLRLSGNEVDNVDEVHHAGQKSESRQRVLQRIFRAPAKIPQGDPEVPEGLLVGGASGDHGFDIDYPLGVADEGENEQRIDVYEVRAAVCSETAEKSRL